MEFERPIYLMLLHCFVCLWTLATAFLVDKPHDLVSLVNSTVVLRCKTNLSGKEVDWRHLPAGLDNTNTEDIFDNGQLHTGPQYSRFSVAEYDLTITNLQFNDSGWFGCCDDNCEARERIADANLTVVSDISHEVVNSSENVLLQCSVLYAGNIAPACRWTDADKTDLHKSTDIACDSEPSSGREKLLKTTITLKLQRENIGQFTCIIAFAGKTINWTFSEVSCLPPDSVSSSPASTVTVVDTTVKSCEPFDCKGYKIGLALPLSIVAIVLVIVSFCCYKRVNNLKRKRTREEINIERAIQVIAQQERPNIPNQQIQANPPENEESLLENEDGVEAETEC